MLSLTNHKFFSAQISLKYVEKFNQTNSFDFFLSQQQKKYIFRKSNFRYYFVLQTKEELILPTEICNK